MVKDIISIVSFLSAIVIGFIALFLPPPGIIDNSVLWFSAQLLLFVSGLLGINMNFDVFNRRGKTENSEK